MRLKSMILAALFCSMFLTVLPAQEQTANTKPEGWELLQIAMWDGFPTSQNTVTAGGFRVGLPVCGGEAPVNGLEIGLLGASSDDVNGVQIGTLAAISKKACGLKFGVVNWTEELVGLELGLVNVSTKNGWQIGLINIIKDSPLPFMIICNVKF